MERWDEMEGCLYDNIDKMVSDTKWGVNEKTNDTRIIVTEEVNRDEVTVEKCGMDDGEKVAVVH